MKTDLPPWKEDPNNPTRKSSEKRTDKYGNEIKNVAKHLARKAMNSVKEAWMVKKGTEVVSTHKTKDEADVKAMKHPLFKVYAKEEFQVDEVAPPGAKFERMVKHIKKSYAKDGKLTDKEKSIAYATAWKAKNEEVEHENCGTPECCGQCDTAEVAEESGKSKQYIEITHVLGQKKRVPVHPLNAYKALNRYRNDPTTKSARIVSEEYPRKGFPEEGEYGYHPNPGMKPQESDKDEDMDVAYKKATEKEGRKPLNAQTTEVSNKVEEAYGMWKVDFPKQHAGKAVAAGSVHVKAQNTAHAHKVAAKRVGVDHKAFKSKVTKSSVLPEDVDSFADALIKRNKQNLNKSHVVNAARIAGMDGKKLMSAVNKKVGRIKEETEGKVYSVHVKGDSEQHNSPEFKKHLTGWGGEHHYTSDKGAAYKFKKEYQATGFHHGVRSMFKKLDSENDGHVKEGYMPTSDQPTDANKKTADKVRALFAKEKKTVKEELGKSNEWGTDALRKKYAAATPGQEGLTAKNIPTFDARYDDVPTQYCGGIQKEETLTEISAKGAIAREKFKARIQQVLSDPKAIAKAKKTIAKKKAAEADAPKNLVHQLHKSQSINAKVKFYDGKEHEIAPNHHDKFMNKYHGLKSSIEKEALVSRAHKSHSEFLKAIHEELDISQEKPCTDCITPANYPTPPIHDDLTDYNSDDRHDEYDIVAIENDVAAEIETAEWEDLIDYYEDEDLDYEDSEEDIAEGITPQGRLKKRFNMMRTKGRRNLARNMALKRVATPDRIKSRSVRAARNMVYSRVLRGRDRSSLSASEKSRIEGMVKRMAPMVGRLSVRLQQKERMIDRKRINNRNKRKKK